MKEKVVKHVTTRLVVIAILRCIILILNEIFMNLIMKSMILFDKIL